MSTTTEAARALRRNIQVRAEACSHDELRAIDRFLARLEVGRETYGPLDLATNRRSLDDWREELAQEREDWLVYQAIVEVVEHDRRVEAIAAASDYDPCDPNRSSF